MNFVKLFGLPALILTQQFLFIPTARAADALTFHGKLTEADGTPLTATSAAFTIQVRSDGTGANDCLLYQETHTSVPLTNGVFSIKIGTGTRASATIDGGNSFAHIFSNSKTISLASSSGNCAASYTPTSTSTRVLRTSYNDGTVIDTIPDVALNWTPQSLYAQNSGMLGGVSATQFLQVTGATPQVLSASDLTNLTTLIAGTNTNYLAASALPTCSAGQFISAPGVCATPIGGGGGSFTTVISANNFLSVLNSGTSATLTINTGITSQTLVVGDDSRITGAFQSATSLGGDLSGTLPNPTLAVVVSAGTGTKVTFDTKGRVIASTTLSATDIPTLDISKITGITSSTITTALGFTPLNPANNLNDVVSATVARTNLGLGNIAVINTNASTSQYLRGDGTWASIPSGASTTDDLPEGATNLYYTDARSVSATLSAVLNGLTTATNSVVTSTDSVLIGLGKLQAQISAVSATAGSKITSLNGSTSPAQTFANGTSGTAPNFSTTTSVHTLNIPFASATSVTAGLISKTDYDLFTNKLNATSAAVISTLGYTPLNPANSLSDIASATVARTNLGLGNVAVINTNASTTQYLRGDGTWASIPAGASTTDDLPEGSTNLYYTNARSVSATLSAVLNGLTTATNSAVTSSDTVLVGIGKLQAQISAVSSAVSNNVTSATAFINAGNSFGASATLGTQDAQALQLLTNDSPRMTITSGGNVGIGTSAPGSSLHTIGVLTVNKTSSVGGSAIDVLASGNNIFRMTHSTLPNAWYQQIIDGNATSTPALNFNYASTRDVLTMLANGNVGIGTTAPTASLHIKAGTSQTAPLKFTNGTLLTSAQSGTMEYDGTNFYLTDSTNTRRAIATGSSSGTLDNAAAINNASGNIVMTPNGSVVVSSTTASTNSTTGALIVNGGAGIAGNTNIAGLLNVTGAISTSGAVTTTSSVSAPIVYSPTIYGSSAVSGNLTLDSTSDSTKGNIYLVPSGGRVGIGTTSPWNTLHVESQTGTNAVITVRRPASTQQSLFNAQPGGALSAANPAWYFGLNANSNNYSLDSYDGTSTTNRMTVTTSGSVGIGSATPTARLTVVGPDISSATTAFTVQNASGTSLLSVIDAGGQYNTVSSGGGFYAINNFTTTANYGLNWDNSLSYIKGNGQTGGSTNFIAFATSGTERLRIDNNGNVGIGTNAPDSKLHVRNDSSGAEVIGLSLQNNFSTSNTGITLDLNPVSSAAGIRSVQIAGINNGGNQTSMIFRTSNGATPIEKMRIDFAGKVGIGIASPTAYIHIKAGTSAIAPLKFDSGTLLSSAQSGTMEYDGSNFYLTDSTNTRRTIATGSSSGTLDNAAAINNASGNIVMTPNGSVVVSSTTASTNSATGALIVNGGAGIAGNTNIAGFLNVTGAISTSGAVTTTSTIQGTSITATSSVSAPVVYAPIVYGSTAVSGSLTLNSTSNGTKGYVLINPSGGNVGIGTTTPTAMLDLRPITYAANQSGGIAIGSTGGQWTSLYGMKSSAGGVPRVSIDVMSSNSGTTTEALSIVQSGNVGIGTTAPGQTLSVSGNQTVTGYLRVGSSSTPNYTTAGDLTATRFNLGNIANFSGTGFVSLNGTVTDATGSVNAVFIQPTFTPSSTNTGQLRGMHVNSVWTGSNDITIGYSGYMLNDFRLTGNVTNNIVGSTNIGMQLSGSSNNFGTVATATGIYAQPVNSFSNSVTGTITNAVGVDIADSGITSQTLTSQAGLRVKSLSSATNNTGILIGTSSIPTGNFGIYNSSTNNNYFAGNVGIGVTAPSTKLDVRAISYASSQSGGIQIGTTNGEWLSSFRIISDSGGTPRTSLLTTDGTSTGTTRESISIGASGRVGLGIATPTARLHLASGSTTAAPLKFESGTLLASPASGAMEYDGSNFYLTDSTNTRRTIATGSSSGTIDNAGAINNTGGNIVMTPTGSVVVSSTTASTNSTTGALIVNGGAGIAGNTNIAGLLNVTGAISTSGAVTTTSTIQGTSITATSSVSAPVVYTPTIYGGTAANGNITIDSTSNSNKGNVILNPITGYVGIGTSSPGSTLDVSSTATTTTGVQTAANVIYNLTPSADSTASYRAFVMSTRPNSAQNFTGSMFGSYFEVRPGSNQTGNLNTVTGSIATGLLLSTAAPNMGTVTGTYGIRAQAINSSSNSATGSFTNAHGISIINSAITSQTLAKQAGISIENMTTGVSNTNLLIGTSTIPTTGNFSIYNSSSYTNYFNGNLGIGTTSPSAPLHVRGTSTGVNLLVVNSGETNDTLTVKRFNSGLTDVPGSTYGTQMTSIDSGHWVFDLPGNDSNDGFYFRVPTTPTSSTTPDKTAFVIKASGNIGIGTTAPTSGGLQITKNGASGVSSLLLDGTIYSGGTGTTTKPFFLIQASGTTTTAWSTGGTAIGVNAASGFSGNLLDLQNNGTSYLTVGAYGAMVLGSSTFTMTGTSPQLKLGPSTSVQSAVNDSLGQIPFSGLNSTWSSFTGANIKDVVTNVTAGTETATLTFQTIVSGTLADRMTIYNGNVGIGTAVPDARIMVDSGSTIGRYTSSGWTHSSDRRLKQDITPIQSSLDKILKLEGVNYSYIKDKQHKKQIGFIAQDVEKVFPEVVDTDPQGYKSMVYANLVAPVVNAIKELYNKIKIVEIDVASTNRAIASLKTENEVKDKVIAALKAKTQKVEQENAAIKAYLCSKDKKAAICK